MKILFVNSIPVDIWGGMEEWIRLVASGLQSRGHSCIVAGRRNSQFLTTIVKIHPEIQSFPYRFSSDFSPMAIASLARVMRQHEINLVVANFNRDLRLGGLAAKLTGNIPVIWSLGIDLTGSGWLHHWLTPQLAGSVLVPSEALKAEILQRDYMHRTPVQVIPIGIPDLSHSLTATAREKVRSSLGLTPESIAAVTVGRLVDQKGHDILLKAFYHIAATYPQLKLVWLGDGPNRESLVSQIDSLGLSGRVILAGMRPDIAEILPAFDLMVHPSRVEPYGIAVLEGMRAGLPIVASKVGGIPEVTGAAAFALVQAGDDISLGAVIGQLASSQESRRVYGRRARERFLQTLTFEHMIANIETYFREVSGAN